MTEPNPSQEALQSSETRYRRLFESARDGILILDADTLRITDGNPFMTELSGYSRAGFLGKELWQIGLFKDKTQGRETLRKLQETGRLRCEDLPLQTRQGESREVEFVSNVYREGPRRVIQCNIRDITDRKRREEEGRLLFESCQAAHAEARTANTVKDELAGEELRDSEEKYRVLLDGVQDYAIFMLDAQGRVASWHAGAERLKGYTAEQIIGRHFSCFFPAEEIEQGKPEEVLRLTAANGRHEQQGMRVRKDGTQFLANVALTALRDPAGSLRGFSEVSHDLSESKESEARYRGLLEAAPDAMVVVSQDGKIVLLNVQAEKQFGYRRDELVGQRVTNIIPEGFAERIIADGLRSPADALAQQIGTGIELTGRRKNGSEFPIEIMLSPLESAEGILVTAAIRDISVRQQAEAHLLQKVEELNRSNEELEQFAYIASHDLQEPLRMVASYTQLLSRRYKGKLDSDADEFIGFAVDGASRMQRLIQDLLAYSRVRTKGQELLDTSSEEALQHALTNLRGTIEDNSAVVTYDPLPTVLADQVQLIQVFQNLIGNAIKYQSSGVPRVHISAARNGGEKWGFSVKDNGIGIDSQYFDKIFGMFQRLHKREEFDGTGIGLAICKKIIERHGGDISVESKKGEGSAFSFSLAGGKGKSC